MDVLSGTGQQMLGGDSRYCVCTAPLQGPHPSSAGRCQQSIAFQQAGCVCIQCSSCDCHKQGMMIAVVCRCLTRVGGWSVVHTCALLGVVRLPKMSINVAVLM